MVINYFSLFAKPFALPIWKHKTVLYSRAFYIASKIKTIIVKYFRYEQYNVSFLLLNISMLIKCHNQLNSVYFDDNLHHSLYSNFTRFIWKLFIALNKYISSRNIFDKDNRIVCTLFWQSNNLSVKTHPWSIPYGNTWPTS